jgi:hypothetical protein
VLAHGSIVHHFGCELQKPLPFPNLWNLTWLWTQLNKNWVYFVVSSCKIIHNVYVYFNMWCNACWMHLIMNVFDKASLIWVVTL